MEKMNNDQMEGVAGGADIDKETISNLFPTKKSKCVDCGKEIKVYNGPISMHGSLLARHIYYQERCKECAIKNPYMGEVYDKDKDMFVKKNDALYNSPDGMHGIVKVGDEYKRY